MNDTHIPAQAARLNAIPPYVFVGLNQQVAAVEKHTGRKVLNLGAGNPDIPPSKRHIDAYAEFMAAPDAHLYPGYKAIPELADALIHHYKKRFNVTIDASELLPLNGGKDGIAHLPIALFNEGEEVLVPDPGYPAYGAPAQLVGARPVTYTLHPENNFRLDLAAIEKKLSTSTRYIWVNFPSNPTGSVATLDDLTNLVEFTRAHQLFILYDNAYADITFGGFVAPSILQVEGAKDIAVEIGSFSKSHSFAGYRMGWIAGNSQVIARLGVVKSQLDSGMSIPLQRLGAHALTHTDVAWQSAMITEYQQRRDQIAALLDSLGLTYKLPQGGLYLWAKIPSAATNSQDFCMDLLHRQHILLTPGSAYGENGERYVRASFCAAITNIKEYFA